MNNLYRELAPITDAAWASIEEEARRTFGTYVAGRRIADVEGPGGSTRAAVNTGHLGDVEPPADGVIAHLREAQPLVRLRVPFRLNRARTSTTFERGAQDSDWQPLKDAAKKIAYAEDRAVFEGYPAAGITGLRAATTNTALALPADPHDYPDVIIDALTALRLAGVSGPYSLALSTDVVRRDQRDLRPRVPDPAADRAAVRRGDPVGARHRRGLPAVRARRRLHAEPRPGPVDRLPVARRGQSVELYFQESLTFLVYTTEAIVAINPRP